MGFKVTGLNKPRPPRQYGKFRQGKAHETEVRNGLEIFRKNHPRTFYWRRLYDVKDFLKKCPECGYDMLANLQIPAQACDYQAIYKGTVYMLEAKSTQNKDGWLLSYLRDTQLSGLNEAQRAGAESYIILSNRNRRGHYKCYSLSVALINNLIEREIKVVKWGVIEDLADSMQFDVTELPRNTKKRAWLFDSLFINK